MGEKEKKGERKERREGERRNPVYPDLLLQSQLGSFPVEAP